MRPNDDASAGFACPSSLPTSISIMTDLDDELYGGKNTLQIQI